MNTNKDAFTSIIGLLTMSVRFGSELDSLSFINMPKNLALVFRGIYALVHRVIDFGCGRIWLFPSTMSSVHPANTTYKNKITNPKHLLTDLDKDMVYEVKDLPRHILGWKCTDFLLNK